MLNADVSNMQIYEPQSTSASRLLSQSPFILAALKQYTLLFVLKFRPLGLNYLIFSVYINFLNYSEPSFESNKITLFVGIFATLLTYANKSESLFNLTNKILNLSTGLIR